MYIKNRFSRRKSFGSNLSLSDVAVVGKPCSTLRSPTALMWLTSTILGMCQEFLQEDMRLSSQQSLLHPPVSLALVPEKILAHRLLNGQHITKEALVQHRLRRSHQHKGRAVKSFLGFHCQRYAVKDGSASESCIIGPLVKDEMRGLHASPCKTKTMLETEKHVQMIRCPVTARCTVCIVCTTINITESSGAHCRTQPI
jgi:hypothetical protein